MIYFNRIFYFGEDCESLTLNFLGFKFVLDNVKNRNKKKLISLIKNKKEKKALRLLELVIEKYGLDFIRKNIFLSNFAKTNHNQDETILKNSHVYEVLNRNREAKLFDKYLTSDKTIAIVGNSGCEIGKNKGKEIDSHDIVIRFNNYPEGYENDYGSKTNVWVHSCDPEIVYNRDISSFDFVLWRYNFFTRNIKSFFQEELYSNIKNHPEKIISLSEELVGTSKFMDIKIPTTGAVLTYIFIKRFNSLKNVDFYGFSFLENLDDMTHYYDNMCSIAAEHPEFSKEQKTLIRLVKKYKDKDINEKTSSSNTGKKREQKAS